MSIRAILVAGVAVVLCGSSAHAGPMSKGTVELSPSLSFSHNSLRSNGTDDGSLTTLLANTQVGYCLSNLVEIIGGPLLTHQSVDPPSGGSVSATSFGLSGGVRLNFASSGNIVPFVGAAVGFASNSGDGAFGTETTTIAPILQGGIRVLVGPSGSVNLGVGYQHESNAFGVKDESSNTFAFEVGVSLFPVIGP